MTLIAENIAFERNDQFLFQSISCELSAGEYLQICGINGCGKSTLLRIFAGLIESHAGKIFWKKQAIDQINDVYRENINYIGHLNAVHPFLTVEENLKLYSALSKQNLHFNHAIETLSLTRARHKQAHTLSAGQRRRLSLAKLFIKNCPLWILDEPTTALDAEGQSILFSKIDEHLQQGGMAVIATHHEFSLKGNNKRINLGENHA